MHLSRCYYAIWDKDAETVNLLFNIFIRLCCCARSYRAEGKSQQNCLEYHLGVVTAAEPTKRNILNGKG